MKRARSRANAAIDECRTSGEWKEAAIESFLLADSLEKMFHSQQYFGDGAQLDSYSTALEAAEDARDNVVDLQNSRTIGVDPMKISPSQVEREYRRNTIASALMVAWCGLWERADTKPLVRYFRHLFHLVLLETGVLLRRN